MNSQNFIVNRVRMTKKPIRCLVLNAFRRSCIQGVPVRQCAQSYSNIKLSLTVLQIPTDGVKEELIIKVTVLYSVANGSVTAKGIRRKYSILPRLTTKRQYVLGINTKCYNRQTIFSQDIIGFQVNPATPRKACPSAS
ncbi:hypothetical protein NQ317_008400 [Molorchus minor]|uniref:Uncharacterized protein n=1 Tax=Molorchus minor TaxID=1323400 RepID=A0ABQ9K5T1_9CUCU|nr:hypothetical protein NQ317_008400 [Molorchus minor]